MGKLHHPNIVTVFDARIDEIVFKTLEKERELRQQSATEVKTEMHRALQPGQCNPSPPAQPKKSGIFRGIAKLAFGSLLAGALGIALLARIGEGPQVYFQFGLICVLLAFLLGLVSWRERLGKFAVATSGLFSSVG